MFLLIQSRRNGFLEVSRRGLEAETGRHGVSCVYSDLFDILHGRCAQGGDPLFGSVQLLFDLGVDASRFSRHFGINLGRCLVRCFAGFRLGLGNAQFERLLGFGRLVVQARGLIVSDIFGRMKREREK